MNFMANPIFSYVNRIIEISFLNSLFPKWDFEWKY